ncbi:MAG: hypothetical protein JJU27_13970 [Gammaproteobacteria bacterium]|nr:hypothetical protein [Gammaproteobacteria bacterium]
MGGELLMPITKQDATEIAGSIRRYTDRLADRLLDLLATVEDRLAGQTERISKLERSHAARLAELEQEVRVSKAVRQLEDRVRELEQLERADRG